MYASCLPIAKKNNTKEEATSLFQLLVCISFEMGYFCMVPGCSSGTRKALAVSFHLLPRDLELCKQWLRAINHKFGEDTALEAVKQRKVCSLHFKPEDFEFNVLRKKRAALLNSAIPSIFTFPGDDEQPSGTSRTKPICLEVRLTRLLLITHTDSLLQESSTSHELY